MKALLVAIFLYACAAPAAAQSGPLPLSPALLKAAFNSPSDSTDYFLAGTVSGVLFTYADQRSFYVLGTDTTLRPEQGDELIIRYPDSVAAMAAYERLVEYASNGNSGLFKALRAGAFTGLYGDTMIVHWHAHDYERLDDKTIRRRFQSTEFTHSFEIHRKLILLK